MLSPARRFSLVLGALILVAGVGCPRTSKDPEGPGPAAADAGSPDAGPPAQASCQANADCRGGEVCRGDLCRVACAAPAECSGFYGQCDTGLGYCVQCTDTAQCGTNAVCRNQVCTFSCQSNDACAATEYCESNTGACKPRECERNADCQGGYVCTSFRCVSVDPIVCTANAVTCEGNTVVRCNRDGTATTRESCAEASSCAPGGDGGVECRTRVCSPNALGCSNAHTATVCDATGTVETVIPCGESTYCSQGLCINQVCTPSSRACSADVLRECNAEGSGSTNTPCSATPACTSAQYGCACSGDACAPRMCSPGASTCVGNNQKRQCAPDGMSFLDLVTCEAQCVSGACLPASCTAGSGTCTGTTMVTCNSNGTSYTTTECGTGNQTCNATDGGVQCGPRQCTPNAVGCTPDGTAITRCDAFGHASVEACGAHQFCSGGACQDQVCQPGQRTCVGTGAVAACNAQGSAVTTSPCTAPATCANGQCACVPQCGGRQCGPDPVCGQECGGCPAGTCQADGHCAGGSRLLVQLTWNTDKTDLDLSLRPGADDFCSPRRCYYANCKPGQGAKPEWDGVAGHSSGDPTMDIDDLAGFGPENISVEVPVPGRYTAAVHYYGDSSNVRPATTAQVRIFRDGTLVDTLERTLHLNNTGGFGQGELWDGIQLEVTAAGVTAPEVGTLLSEAPTCAPPDAGVRPDAGTVSGTTGSPCVQDAECAGTTPLCLTADAGYPGGYCSDTCFFSLFCMGGGTCLSDNSCYEDCAPPVCSAAQRTECQNSGGTWNASTCTCSNAQPNPCRTGYQCAGLLSADGGITDNGVCLPGCATSQDCASGWACNAGRCIR